MPDTRAALPSEHHASCAPAGDAQGTQGLGVRTRTGPATPRRPRVFTNLERLSFTHSCIYVALLVCAFLAGKPQPATFVLGLTHGLLWIAMSLTCIVCVRLRIVPLRLAAAVAVLGGIGPFFGSYEFIREQRRRASIMRLRDTESPSASGSQTPTSHDHMPSSTR
jgi:hypothetical protein